MIYVKNNLSFDIMIKAKDSLNHLEEFNFPALRRYTDTGNVFTSGVTPLTEGDFEALKKVKQFKKMLKDREFELTDAPATEDTANQLEIAQARIKELENENEGLKEAGTSTVTDADYKKLLDENASMKAQLEKLGSAKDDKKNGKNNKASEAKETTDESTEGF